MSALPSLTAIKAFNHAAQAGNISVAGTSLHVSHSAVSHQIRQLEQWLGCKLFVRHSQGVTLTETGRRLHAVTDRALADIAQACVDIRAGQADPVLTLGCPGSFMLQWLIPRLDSLAAAWPNLTLTLHADARPEHLAGGQIDALLYFGHAAAPADVLERKLADNDLGPVCAPTTPALAQDVQTLLAQPLLGTASYPRAWHIWAQAAGLPAADLKTARRFDQLMYMIQASIAGLGVGIAPSVLVREELRTGRLVAPLGFLPSGDRIALWFASTHRHRAALQAVGERMARALRQNRRRPAGPPRRRGGRVAFPPRMAGDANTA